MPVHEHKQKEKWDKKKETETSQSQKKERKKQWDRERPGNSPENAKKQETVRAHGTQCRRRGRDRTSPWWSWKVCDFDVTGSCDVISPDHFVRGFYYSSYRRCGLIFLVLQKDNKILVHNLSIHEKLEQSTHWNILKKWGKDFTFGSGCTVPLDNLKVGLSSSTKSSSTGERDLFINAPRSLPRRDAPRMSSSVVRRSAFLGFAFPEQVVWKQSWQMKWLDENHEHPLGYCAMGMTQTMT